MTTAFVTGANGFLGCNLVEQLAVAGWQVIALCQPGTNVRKLVALGATCREGDILDPSSLAGAVPKDVDALFHLAADTSVWSRNNARQMCVNVEGTRNVVEAALHNGAKRLIHTSTWTTYGLDHEAISEATPQTGGSSWVNYVKSKFLGETEVRQAVARGLDAVILNPVHLMGRYDTRNWARMFTLAAAGRLRISPPGAGNFAHAEAVAQAHIAAAARGMCGENYIIPGIEASYREVIAMIGELVGSPTPGRAVPAWLFRLAARAKVAAAAITGEPPDLTPEAAAIVLSQPRIVSDKAARTLGYRPAPLRTMLEDTHRWLMTEGMLACAISSAPAQADSK